MTELLIGAFLLIGPLVLVASVAVGLLGYTPERANAIRSAEDTPQVVIEEIRHIVVRQPTKFPHDRLDRHPAYISLHIAVWCYAWCIFFGAPITSNLTSLSAETRMTMAACFVVGSTLVLSGAAMGGRICKWTLLDGVRDNVTSPMLSDDIRLPYAFNAAGMFAISISMGLYASTSFKSTFGSLGGWITGCSTFMSAILFIMFVTRIRQYSKARDLLILEAVARLEMRGDGNGA